MYAEKIRVPNGMTTFLKNALYIIDDFKYFVTLYFIHQIFFL